MFNFASWYETYQFSLPDGLHIVADDYNYDGIPNYLSFRRDGKYIEIKTNRKGELDYDSDLISKKEAQYFMDISKWYMAEIKQNFAQDWINN